METHPKQTYPHSYTPIITLFFQLKLNEVQSGHQHEILFVVSMYQWQLQSQPYMDDIDMQVQEFYCGHVNSDINMCF